MSDEAKSPDYTEQKKKGMSNLAARVLTALVLVPLLLLLMFWERHEGWWAFTMLALGLASVELGGMTLRDSGLGDRAVAVGSSLGVGAAIYWWLSSRPLLVAVSLAAGLMLILLYVMLRPRDIEDAGKRISGLVLTFLYGGLLFPFLALLKRLPHGSEWVLLTCSAIWLGDTGAYFVGRFAGRHKLYPKVSPKKTWEGAFGGLAASVVAGLAAHFWYLPQLGLLDAVAVTVPAGVLGQAGDLCESLLKRSYGIKDSGNLLPGHGGVLDRLDALVFAAPYVFAYAVLVFPIR